MKETHRGLLRWIRLMAVLALGVAGTVRAHEEGWEDATAVSELNTSGLNGNPALSPDGLEIYFGSNRPGGQGGFSDIWFARREGPGEPFGKPQNIDLLSDIPLNSSSSDIPSCVSPNNLELYFWSDRNSPPEIHDIFVARRETPDIPWQSLSPVDELNTEFKEVACCLSPDGLELIFVSNRPGGAGSRDLWLARRADFDAKWQVVRNIAELNTSARERVPSFSADGRTLFFDRKIFNPSRRFEIWCATRNDDGFFENDRRLGTPVNGGLNLTPAISLAWPAVGSELFWTRCFSGGGCDIYVATWSACPFDLQAERTDGSHVRLTWTNGVMPSSVDIFRDGQLIAEDAPATPSEYLDRPESTGLLTYRLEFDVSGEDCAELTTTVDNTPPCDTHCRDILIESIQTPDGNVRLTADAWDESGDTIHYTLSAQQGFTRITAGPQLDHVFDITLSPGSWTIMVSVEDDSTCSPSAADSMCRERFELPAEFLRGDCNDDGEIDISDAVCTLNWLFLGSEAPGCIAALNTNGDENIDIADPVYSLWFSFLGGPAPVTPFPDCGTSDLEADEELGCEETSCT